VIKMEFDSEYPLARRVYVYKWNDIAIGRLNNIGDAIVVDGDKHEVRVYIFREFPF